MSASRPPSETATGVLEELLAIAKHDEEEGGSAGRGRFAIGDVTEAFGRRAFGPFLIILPLIEMSPLGGLPTLPTLLAFVIALVAGQLLLGKRTLWLPGFVRHRSVKASRILGGAPKLRRVTHWIDRHTSERWRHLTRRGPVKLAAGIIVLLCLTVPVLEFVPFASTAPMAAILAFGVAFLAKDGRLMVLAFGLSTLALGVVGYVVFGVLLGGGA